MTDLSKDARELISRARAAERADLSAKKRVRAALATSLGMPPVPLAPALAGSVGISASKIVLLCSLTAVGVAGTAALVRTRPAAKPHAISQPLARQAPLAPGAVASGQPVPPVPVVQEIAVGEAVQPSLPVRESASGRRLSKPARALEPVENPRPVPAPPILPERAVAPAPAAVPAAPAPQAEAADPSSSWRSSQFPTPIPNRETTKIALAPNSNKECSAERELSLLSAAQAALREADGRRALGLLEKHAATCPSATFWEERSAARVLALCLLHRESQALAEAAQLASLAPRSPLLARLRTSCAATAVKP
jgi:hypothetical protein